MEIGFHTQGATEEFPQLRQKRDGFSAYVQALISLPEGTVSEIIM